MKIESDIHVYIILISFEEVLKYSCLLKKEYLEKKNIYVILCVCFFLMHSLKKWSTYVEIALLG